MIAIGSFSRCHKYIVNNTKQLFKIKNKSHG